MRLPQRLSLAALALIVALTLALAGCSSSGGSTGINFQLGLQGSTVDNPAPPPKIASNGPSGEYAFVYDNQVWAHLKGASGAVQITRLTLSSGATLRWGPLVWSPSGNSLAFALVQNLNPDQPTRSFGSIYYINLVSCLTSANPQCPTFETQSTGSVYGHTYDWLGDDWLISGGGGGLLAYDVSDPNGRRVWQLRTTVNEQQDYGCGSPRSYGDVQVSGATVYYTCLDLSNVGAVNVTGSATLNSLSLASVQSQFGGDRTTRDEQIATALSGGLPGTQITSLGNVYLDAAGDAVAGAWAVGGSSVYYEQIGAVDAQHGAVARTVCLGNLSGGGGCDSSTLPAVTSQKLTARPQLGLGPNGAIAYQGDALYLSGQGASIAVTSTYAPAWVSSGAVIATNVISTTTDASGVTRNVSNLVTAQTGAPTTFIAGASDIALH